MKKIIFICIAITFIFAANTFADETYRIKKGDTLSGISKKYKVSIKELMANNKLKKSSNLRIGKTIVIKKGAIIYTARNNDTLSKISKKFKLTPEELKEFNQIESDDINAGQKLFVQEPTEVELSRLKLEDEIKALTKSEELEKLSVKERVVLFAKKFINIPYKFGGTSVMGIDCSAYVQKVYDLIGIELPRSARLQFREGEAIDKDSLTIGDLVFFKTYASFPSHVGIYLGNDLFIHASASERKIRISNLTESYYVKRYIGARRFLSEETDNKQEDIPQTEEEKPEQEDHHQG